MRFKLGPPFRLCFLRRPFLSFFILPFGLGNSHLDNLSRKFEGKRKASDESLGAFQVARQRDSKNLQIPLATFFRPALLTTSALVSPSSFMRFVIKAGIAGWAED